MAAAHQRESVHISQPCTNEVIGCKMKVETLLPVGATIPEPRVCVQCLSEARKMGLREFRFRRRA